MGIKRALISVSDKTGLDKFAKKLQEDYNVEILSTGGTCAFLRAAGVPVKEVSEYTGMPELFDGRVKTLHPRIHGGLLQDKKSETHQEQALKNDIPPIDLLVVNLYPFKKTIEKETCLQEEAIEQIDIGGAAMIRSAAKNHAAVTTVIDPNDYSEILETLQENEGSTTNKLRKALALKAFHYTATYDLTIVNYLGETSKGENDFLSLLLPLKQELRYGDNPHQTAQLYGNFSTCFTQLQGKQLSYTNILDIEAAADLILDFRRPTVAILKHTNPCGVGQDDDDLRIAWQKAFETDRQAPFGGVIVINRPMNAELARVISQIFTDIIIAPDYEPEARAILQKKKNLRLMKLNEAYQKAKREPIIRSGAGGILVMERDNEVRGLDKLEEKVVTERPPTQAELIAMRFAWRIVKHVKSNAIVLCKEDRTVGIGAGQMSRVDSAKLAVWKAQQANLDMQGSVVASDAMFPFADGLKAAISGGATACIQPGGSKNDPEVIAAANEAGLTMVFTEHRHFRH